MYVMVPPGVTPPAGALALALVPVLGAAEPSTGDFDGVVLPHAAASSIAAAPTATSR